MIASDIPEIPQATPVQKEMQDPKTEIPKKEDQEKQEKQKQEKQKQEKKKQKKSYYESWFNGEDYGVLNWFKSVGIVTGIVILAAITLPFIIVGAFIKTAFML